MLSRSHLIVPPAGGKPCLSLVDNLLQPISGTAAQAVMMGDRILARQKGELTMGLCSSHHTYGDTVRGIVVLRTPQNFLLELLEMKFLGECGIDFKCRPVLPLDQPNASSRLAKRREKKTLFTHVRTIMRSQHYGLGVHRFEFDFRFPRRDEVSLWPNTDSTAAKNNFYFNYSITATAIYTDYLNNKHILTTKCSPAFVSSRELTGEPIQYGFHEAALSPKLSVKAKLLSIPMSKSSSTLQQTQTDLYALVQAPSIIITKEPVSLMLTVQMGPRFSDEAMAASPIFRLTKFKVFLRPQIMLLSEGQTSQVDLSKNRPIQIASWNASKATEIHELLFDHPFDIGRALNITCPQYIRTTFRNEMVRYEYQLVIRAEFEFGGNIHQLRYDDIPIELQPQFIKNDLEDWDYDSSPPAEDPPSDSPLIQSTYSNGSWVPSTPPPTFEQATGEPFRLNSSGTDSIERETSFDSSSTSALVSDLPDANGTRPWLRTVTTTLRSWVRPRSGSPRPQSPRSGRRSPDRQAAEADPSNTHKHRSRG